jgi:hypothetical protein
MKGAADDAYDADNSKYQRHMRYSASHVGDVLWKSLTGKIFDDC